MREPAGTDAVRGVGLLRQSVFGRLAGYEDVNGAERLRHDPAIRWIVGGTAAHSNAASPSRARKSFIDLSRAMLQLSCICEPIPRRRDTVSFIGTSWSANLRAGSCTSDAALCLAAHRAIKAIISGLGVRMSST